MTVFAFQSEKDLKKLYQLLLLLLKQYIFVRFKSLIDSTLKRSVKSNVCLLNCINIVIIRGKC